MNAELRNSCRVNGPISVAVAVSLTVLYWGAFPPPAQAGCGCDKPPPPAAAIRPNVTYAGTPITLFNSSFRAGDVYSVEFTSFSGNTSTVSATVVNRRDLADSIGKPQLVATVPNMAIGPASVRVRDVSGDTVMFIDDSDFTVAPLPIAVTEDVGPTSYPGFRAAIGRDGTFYVSLDMTGVTLPRTFRAQALGYPLVFVSDDVVFYNIQGFHMQLLGENMPGLYSILSTNSPVDSDVLGYSRHEFNTFYRQHEERQAHQVLDDNWHTNGTRHVDHNHLVLAIAGILQDGSVPAPGATPPFTLVLERFTLFQHGVAGIASGSKDFAIDMTDSARTDSYDSRTGAAGHGGDIFSNTQIKLARSVVVDGDAVGTSFTLNDSAQITGLMTPLAQPLAFMSVNVPDLLPYVGDIKLNGYNTRTLQPGSYEVNQVALADQSALYIDNCAGPVTIYITGANGMTLSKGALIHTCDPNPEKFAVYVSSNGPVTLSGDGTFHGVVYAPRSQISVSGNGESFGSFVGLKVKGSNLARIHYDTALQGEHLQPTQTPTPTSTAIPTPMSTPTPTSAPPSTAVPTSTSVSGSTPLSDATPTPTWTTNPTPTAQLADIITSPRRTLLSPGTGVALYSNNTVTPQWAGWNGASFPVVGTATALTNRYRILRGQEAATRPDERIMVGVLDAAGQVRGQMSTAPAPAWSALSINASMGSVSETYWWGADVAYEQLSGDAVMVWNDNTQAANAKLRYSVWNGTAWSALASITGFTYAEPQHLQLAVKPGADEMVLVVGDGNGDHHAVVWNGSSWGNAITLDTTGTAEDDQTTVAVAYETQSGRALVTYNKDVDAKLYYRIWNGARWVAEAAVDPSSPVVVSTWQPQWVVLASDPTSNRIGMMVQTVNGGSGNRVWMSVWDGTVWTQPIPATVQPTGYVYPNIAVGWEQSGQLLAAFGSGGSNKVSYCTWNGSWSAVTVGPDLGAKPNTIVLYPRPGSDQIMLAAQDANSDLNYLLWDGSAWGTRFERTTNTGEVKNQPFTFLWDQTNGPVTVTLSALEDTQISALSPTLNYGASQTLDSYNVGTNIRKALFKFDLSSLPANAVISSASMDLYTYFIGTANTPVRAHRLTADWDENNKNAAGGITNWTQRLITPATNWTTPGGDYDPSPASSITTNGTTAGTYSFPMSGLVQAWVNGTVANHGVILLNDPGFLGVSWRPKEWGTASQQPKLTVTYSLP